MISEKRPDPHAIRRAREDNPKMRERDLAAQLGITEAEFVAAWCGEGTVRIEPRVNDVLTGLEAVGEVMALTRNESAVHEKIGVYDKVVTGNHNAMTLGENIDLRIFPKVWAHGFAVEKRDGDAIRRSLQFFDASGEAVHKVHLRPASNLYAYQQLVERLVAADQSPVVAVALFHGKAVRPDFRENAQIDVFAEHHRIVVAGDDLVVDADLFVNGALVTGKRHDFADSLEPGQQIVDARLDAQRTLAAPCRDKLGFRNAKLAGQVAFTHFGIVGPGAPDVFRRDP